MTSFGVQAEQVDLPRGAFHKPPLTYVTWDGRPVLGLSQNDHRAYLFPVCTPAGVPVTSESPTDHPHHNSVTVGAKSMIVVSSPTRRSSKDGWWNIIGTRVLCS